MPNTSIALQVQPIRIPDPLESAGRVMTLRQLIGQQQIQQLQLAEAKRRAEKSARMQQFGQQAKGNIGTLRDLLYGAGDIEEGLQLDTGLRQRDKATAELSKEQGQLMAELAGSVVFASPEDRATIYPQMVMEWKRLGLPNSDKIPDAWSDSFLPHLQMIASRGSSADKVGARLDEDRVNRFLAGENAPQTSGIRTEEMPMGVGESSYVESPEGVPMFDYLTELDMAEGRKTYRRTPEGMEIMPAQGGVPATGEVPITAGDVDTVADAPESMKLRKKASNLERQAEQLLSMRGGEKKAQELRQLANQFRVEANKMDEQIWKEREQQQPVAGAPGITFDRNTGSYLMNGKPISAEQVQEIAAKQKKAGASSINIGAMTPENAAKTELLNQGISDMAEFKAMLMPGDKIDRPLVLALTTPGFAGAPGTDARIAYSLIYNAIEAKLRAESGAAVPETEVQRMAARFIPSPLDNDEAIRSKVRRMEAFLRGSFQRIKGAGEATTPQGEKPSIKKGVGSGTQDDPWKIKGDAGYDSIKSGEYFIGPDGKVRRKP